MALYETSTQSQFWTVSTERVREMRLNASQKALSRLGLQSNVNYSHEVNHRAVATNTCDTTPGGVGMLVDVGGDPTTTTSSSPPSSSSPPLARPLSIAEEEVLRRFHEQRVARMCRRLRLSSTLIATAVTYFKRFFLERSVMDHNPAVVALSAVYAALKVEEVNMSAHDLVSFVAKDTENAQEEIVGRVRAESLLEVEVSFLQSLEFHLICFHPFNSLSAAEAQFLLYAKRHKLREDEPDEEIELACKKMARDACDVINSRVLYSDMCFSSKPGLIALGALVFCARKRNREEQLLAMLGQLFRHAASVSVIATGSSSNTSASSACMTSEELDEVCSAKLADVERVAALINSMSDSKSDVEVVRALETRRKMCEDAVNNPESELYQQLAEKKRREQDENKLIKHRSHKEKLQKEQDAFLAGIIGSSDSGSHQQPSSSAEPMDISAKKPRLV